MLPAPSWRQHRRGPELRLQHLRAGSPTTTTQLAQAQGRFDWLAWTTMSQNLGLASNVQNLAALADCVEASERRLFQL
jgi:hypothetical protein